MEDSECYRLDGGYEMTNREWIDNLSNERLAKYLSEWIDCGNCPVTSSCGGWTCREKFEKWLQSEHKGEDPNGVN